MRNLLLIIVLLITSNIYANKIDTLKTKSKITDVTVFLDGAQITREVSINIAKGKHLLLIDNLPAEVNAESIQVSAIKNCETHSVKHEYKYPSSNNPEILAFEDKIEKQELKIIEIGNKIKVFSIEEEIILKNSMLSKTNEGSNIIAIKEAAAFYRTKLNEIKSEKLKLQLAKKEIKDKIRDLYKELNKSVSELNRTFSRVIITVDCESAVTTSFTVSYFVNSAGWSPFYDFRVEDTDKPLNVVYNANIFQSTGENWDNVNIILSSNSPSISNDIPNLDTWFITRSNKRSKKNDEISIATYKGLVSDEITGKPIEYANVFVLYNNALVTSTTTNSSGMFTIKPIKSGYYEVKISYIGYHGFYKKGLYLGKNEVTYKEYELQSSESLLAEVTSYNPRDELIINYDKVSSGGKMTSKAISKMPGRSANSVAVTVGGVFRSDDGEMGGMRGQRSNGTATYIDGVRVESSTPPKPILLSGVEAENGIASQEYKIKTKYTIPSDGEDYTVRVKEVELPVNYVYNSIPKHDKDVFLVTEITNWSKLNLLSATANVYYKGTYTGKTFIDTKNTEDTLDISLSRDKDIIVERTLLKEKSKASFVGKNVKQTVNWNISIRNNKSKKVKVFVYDQIPISENEDVRIEVIALSGGKLNPKTGEVVWEIELEPNQTKEIDLAYIIKYPNYRKVIIE